MAYQFRFGALLRFTDEIVEGVLLTLQFSVVTMICGLIIGLLVAMASTGRVRALRIAARIYVESIRNTPLLVQLFIVFFGLPIIIHHAAVTFSHPKAERPREFLAVPVDTATGPLSGASAWLQVLIIPLSLALAATLIGAASLLVR